MLHSRCEDQIPVITLIPSDQGSVFPPGLFWLEQSVIWSVFTEDNIFIHILFTILENKWTDSILIKSLREKHQGKTWGCPHWYKNKLYGWNEYKQHMSIHSSDSYSAQQHTGTDCTARHERIMGSLLYKGLKTKGKSSQWDHQWEKDRVHNTSTHTSSALDMAGP